MMHDPIRGAPDWHPAGCRCATCRPYDEPAAPTPAAVSSYYCLMILAGFALVTIAMLAVDPDGTLGALRAFAEPLR